MSSKRPSWDAWYKQSAWKKLRAAQLNKQPYCECPHHKGKRIRADHPTYGSVAVVDHIVPHKGDRRKFFDPRNLQTMTKQCHDRYKQSMERGGSGFKQGCDTNGVPLDQAHHWHS